tara:strand:+ start:103 stop:519 length:417 start_codon:yes stop_codon:yes gene_type:complete
MKYEKTDGGRKDAGYRGQGGDCVTRAIAIATDTPYRRVRLALTDLAVEMTGGINKGVANGCPTPIAHRFLTELGWEAVPADMYINELPKKQPVIACLTTRSHWVAVVNNTVKDTWDSRNTNRTQNGWMKLKGYYRKTI